jgi:NADPH2:quinone reductase
VGGSIGHTAFDLLSDGGRFCAFGMASGSFADVSEGHAKARQITLIRGGRSSAEELRELARSAFAEAGAGRLHAVIGRSFPLEQAADAHAAIEQRVTVGKTLLLIQQPTRPARAEGAAS